MTFYVKLITNKFPNDLSALIKEFNNEISEWNELDYSISLHTFLGMPKDIYDKIVQDQSYLKELRNKNNTSVFDLIEILKSFPPDTTVLYDSCCDLSPSEITLDLERNVVLLNY